MPYRDPQKRREWNVAHVEQDRDSKHRSRVKQTGVNKEKLRAIKAEKGCCCCGESDPRCLDFHHRDPTQKTMTIASSYSRAWRRLLDEIAYCEVICANCHRKLHGGD